MALKRKPKYPKVCECCGAEFMAMSKDTKYCSDTCSRKMAYARRMDRMVYKCKVCGKEFKGREGVKPYCSEACRRDAGKGVKCALCGKMFKPKTPTQKYCSKACSIEDKNRHGAVEYHRVCKGCGKEFVTTSPARLYCSDACSRRMHQTKMKEHRRKKRQAEKPVRKAKDSSLSGAVRTIEEYNKKHGLNLSYGQAAARGIV